MCHGTRTTRRKERDVKSGIAKYLVGLLLCSSVGLIGCRTTAERQQAEAHWRAEQAAKKEAERQAYMNTLASNCVAYGFQPATPAFAQCLQTENIAEQQKEAIKIQKQAVDDAESARRSADRKEKSRNWCAQYPNAIGCIGGAPIF